MILVNIIGLNKAKMETCQKKIKSMLIHLMLTNTIKKMRYRSSSKLATQTTFSCLKRVFMLDTNALNLDSLKYCLLLCLVYNTAPEEILRLCLFFLFLFSYSYVLASQFGNSTAVCNFNSVGAQENI